MRKPAFWVSNQVGHKPGGTAIEDCQRLLNSDLESREIVLSMQKNKGADKPRCYSAADLCHICKKQVLSWHAQLQ